MPASAVNLLVVTDEQCIAFAISQLLKHAEHPRFNCLVKPSAALSSPGFAPEAYDICLFDTSRAGAEIQHLITMLLGRCHDLPLVMITAENDLAVDAANHPEGIAGCLPLSRLEGENLTRQLCFALARHRSEKRWRRMATHDEVTDLPHRSVFLESLDGALARAERAGQSLAVLYLRLDDFDRIYQQFGRDGADEILRQVARRLRDALRRGDSLARAGGDAFLVLQLPTPDPMQAEWLARRLQRALSTPLTLGRDNLIIHGSFGIACYPRQGPSAETLVLAAEADVSRGRVGEPQSGVAPLPDNRAPAFRTATEPLTRQMIAEAIAGEEFRLYFQPIIDTDTDTVLALEVLLRWQRGSSELLPAAQFIRTLEDRGLAQHLGSWIIRESFSWQRRWSNKGFTDVAVAVNLSAMEMQPEHLIPVLRENLPRAAAPFMVWLEVSSSLLSSQRSAAFAALQEAGEMGVTLVLDNIGGGDSCLETLTQIRARILKVDRAVVQRMNEQVIYRVLAQSTFSLCQGLALTPIASGVENATQRATLQQIGFSRMQGNFFCAPLDGPAIMEWLERRSSCTRFLSAV